MARGAARPQSLSVRVMTDREDCPELDKHDGTCPLWRPNHVATLTGTTETSAAAPAGPLVSRDEPSQLGALRDTLPEGWIMELQPDAEMVWVAFVYQADAPRSRPMFTVCRWSDRVGLFAQWMDGSRSSATAFAELWPILELILDGIFASA